MSQMQHSRVRNSVSILERQPAKHNGQKAHGTGRHKVKKKNRQILFSISWFLICSLCCCYHGYMVTKDYMKYNSVANVQYPHPRIFENIALSFCVIYGSLKTKSKTLCVYLDEGDILRYRTNSCLPQNRVSPFDIATKYTIDVKSTLNLITAKDYAIKRSEGWKGFIPLPDDPGRIIDFLRGETKCIKINLDTGDPVITPEFVTIVADMEYYRAYRIRLP